MARRHSTLKSAVILRRKRRILIATIVFLIVDIALFAWGIVYAANLPSVNIGTIVVNGAEATPTPAIEAIADSLLAGSYAYVFPKSNALWYPKQAIAAAIASNFPRIKTISVTTNNLSSLSVNVTERQTHALWCGATNDAENCFLMDETGYIFAPAADYGDGLYIKYFGSLNDSLDESGTTTPIGKTFMPSASLSDIENFSAQLVTLGIKPVSITIEPEGDIQFEDSSGAVVLVSPNDFDQAFKDISLVMKERGATSTDFSSIDARFGNKVFWKPRN